MLDLTNLNAHYHAELKNCPDYFGPLIAPRNICVPTMRSFRILSTVLITRSPNLCTTSARQWFAHSYSCREVRRVFVSETRRSGRIAVHAEVCSSALKIRLDLSVHVIRRQCIEQAGHDLRTNGVKVRSGLTRDGSVLVQTDCRISPSVRGVLKTTLFQTRTEFWRTCTNEGGPSKFLK